MDPNSGNNAAVLRNAGPRNPVRTLSHLLSLIKLFTKSFWNLLSLCWFPIAPHNKLLQTQWLRTAQVYHIFVLGVRSWNGFHWAKLKVSTRLHSVQRLPAFLGSWPLPPSWKANSTASSTLCLTLPFCDHFGPTQVIQITILTSGSLIDSRVQSLFCLVKVSRN